MIFLISEYCLTKLKSLKKKKKNTINPNYPKIWREIDYKKEFALQAAKVFLISSQCLNYPLISICFTKL